MSNRSTLLVGAFVVVLFLTITVFSGCLLMGGCFDDGGTETPAPGQPTVTDTPDEPKSTETTTTETPDGPFAGVSFPRGATKSGFDEQTLAEVHRERLSNSESYTNSYKATFDQSAGETIFTHEIRVSGGGDFVRIKHSEPTSRTDLYMDESTSATRSGMTDIYYSVHDRNAESPDLHNTGTLRKLLASGDFEAVDTAENDGETLIVYRADSAASTAESSLPGSQIENYSATVTVSESGVVRSVELSYDATVSGKDMTVDIKLYYGEFGTTTVEEPDWLDTAREQAPEVETSIADDNESISLTHTGGNAIPEGTTLVLVNDNTYWTYTTEQSIEKGNTVHLYLDQNKELQLAQSQPSNSDASSLGPSDYGLTGLKDNKEVFEAVIRDTDDEGDE